MALNELEALLKATIGLDPASLGSSTLERAVRQRATACSLSDWRDYLNHVQVSASELQALVDAAVISETWFFRDREAFAALARLATKQAARDGTERPLRLLSVPCSSGEEPYSIAIALLEAGLAPDRFRIDAVDVSARALSMARRACYTGNAFRGLGPDFIRRHFAPVAEGHQLRPEVTRLVGFTRGNLLDAAFWQGMKPYDFVFCRNVLIYFDRPTQQRVVSQLHRLLAPQGVLFVGPAEAALFQEGPFVSARLPKAFAFRRTADEPAPVTRAGKVQPAPGPAATPARKRPPARVVPQGTGLVSRLELATCLADRGELAEAARLCEAYLKDHGDSAQASYLLGLVRDTCGDLESAEQYYRKALYLDPDHTEALMHLALLKERQGNTQDAAVLRNRARRIQQRPKP